MLQFCVIPHGLALGHAVWTVVFPPECISHCSVAFYRKIRMGTGAELNAAVPAIASRSPLPDLSQKRPLFACVSGEPECMNRHGQQAQKGFTTITNAEATITENAATVAEQGAHVAPEKASSK